MYKIVLLPLEVPASDYCWEYGTDNICHHFDNEGGHGHCSLKLGIIRDKNPKGYEKPSECASLERRENK